MKCEPPWYCMCGLPYDSEPTPGESAPPCATCSYLFPDQTLEKIGMSGDCILTCTKLQHTSTVQGDSRVTDNVGARSGIKRAAIEAFVTEEITCVSLCLPATECLPLHSSAMGGRRKYVEHPSLHAETGVWLHHATASSCTCANTMSHIVGRN